MIHDLDETIKKLLVDGVPLDTSEIDVVFEAPTSEWKSSLARPTINCYLYHMVENHDLRHTDWELNRNTAFKQNGSHMAHTQTRRRLPFRVDFSYMITTWANVIEDEHRLLWRVTAALLRHSIIPPDRLQGDLLGSQEWPVPLKVAQPESIFKNPSDFWSGMETHVKPGVNVITTLALDPDLVFELPLVLTRRVRVGPMDNAAAGYEIPTVQFGGWVLTQRDGSFTPVAEADVLIVERGTRMQTDAAGRFRFDGIPHGRYTLRAQAESGQVERKVDVPGDSYDLILEGRPERSVGSSAPAGDSTPSPNGSHESGKGRRR